MATPPVFVAGAVLTASQLNAAGSWRITGAGVSSVGGTAATASNGVITVGAGNTSVTVTNAFNTDFDNYRIVFSGIVFSSLGAAGYLKLSASSGSTYFGNMIYNVPSSGAIGGVSAVNGTSVGFLLVTASTTGATDAEMVITNPNRALTSNSFGNFAGRSYNGQFSGHDSNAAASTGFTINPSAGSMTGGQIRIYGITN